MSDVRRVSVAGSWYTNDPARLAAEVDGYVTAAAIDPLPSPPRALVAPHAGLMYSGPVAAFGYKAAHAAPYAAIVMVGPSHFVPFRGVSIWPRGSWDTPFGSVAVDDALAVAIAAESPEIVEQPAAHGREHSLEMQLPFVAHLFRGTPIVPLVMGHQTRATAEALGDALARAIAGREKTTPRRDGGKVLLVASSDLSHYEDARTAAAMDGIVLDRVAALDPAGLMDALEREPRHACGGGPMVAVLRAARQLGAREARVLRYADSGDVSGDKSAVVGYMAAAIW
jgi:AmmeMemoRadiSam system protein B